MSAPKRPRIGVCSLCTRSVFTKPTAGGEFVRGVGNRRSKLVPHLHRKPYSITPYVPPPKCEDRDGDDDYRYWHDLVPWFVR